MLNLNNSNRVELIKSLPENFVVGAEIGTCWGEFSQLTLRNRPNTKLYCIDIWENNLYLTDASEGYEKAKQNLSEYIEESRCILIKKKSMEAALDFEDNFFDFIYIDAAHDYASVKEDVTAWYPKVNSGGVLCGHDYGDPAWPGVEKAVNEILCEKGYSINVTGVADSPYLNSFGGDGGSKSWFIQKI